MATARATSKKAATTKVATTRATKRKTETSAPSAKRAKSADEQIDTNRCAICFGTYEDDIIVGSGEDWLQCTWENGSMRCVWKIVQLTVTEIQDFSKLR